MLSRHTFFYTIIKLKLFFLCYESTKSKMSSDFIHLDKTNVLLKLLLYFLSTNLFQLIRSISMRAEKSYRGTIIPNGHSCSWKMYAFQLLKQEAYGLFLYVPDILLLCSFQKRGRVMIKVESLTINYRNPMTWQSHFWVFI